MDADIVTTSLDAVVTSIAPPAFNPKLAVTIFPPLWVIALLAVKYAFPVVLVVTSLFRVSVPVLTSTSIVLPVVLLVSRPLLVVVKFPELPTVVTARF